MRRVLLKKKNVFYFARIMTNENHNNRVSTNKQEETSFFVERTERGVRAL